MNKLVAVVVLACVACGGDDGGAKVDCELTCSPGQVRIQGTVGGQSVDFTRPAENYVFFNKGVSSAGDTNDDGKLSLGWYTAPTTDEVQIRFGELLADGDSTSARGFVKLTDAGIDAGNCETGDDYPSAIEKGNDGEPDRFQLRELKAAPYCSGAASSGSLCGCVMQQ